MNKELLQLLLNKDFYYNNKHRVSSSMFDGSDLKPIYNTIIEAHNKFEGDLSFQEIEALYDVKHPTLSKSKRDNVKIIFRDVANRKPLRSEVAEEVLSKSYKQTVGHEIAKIGLLMEQGEITELSPLKRLIETHINSYQNALR